MKNSINPKQLNKEELIDSLLEMKFSTDKTEGGIILVDVCSSDPCCDGNSRCTQDMCWAHPDDVL